MWSLIGKTIIPANFRSFLPTKIKNMFYFKPTSRGRKSTIHFGRGKCGTIIIIRRRSQYISVWYRSRPGPVISRAGTRLPRELTKFRFWGWIWGLGPIFLEFVGNALDKPVIVSSIPDFCLPSCVYEVVSNRFHLHAIFKIETVVGATFWESKIPDSLVGFLGFLRFLGLTTIVRTDWLRLYYRAAWEMVTTLPEFGFRILDLLLV